MNANLTKTLARAQLKLAKHSPAIFLASGLACLVTGTVLACRATLTIDDVLSEHERKVAQIKEGRDRFSIEKYTDRDYKQDIVKRYVQTAVGMAKKYVVPSALMVAGIGMIVWSNHILNARNTALMAAYTVINERFTSYRNRIRDDHGEAYEDDVYNNRRRIQQKEKVEDPETGKKVTQMVEHIESDGFLSPYAVIFDNTTSSSYKKGYDNGNKFFLECVYSQVNNAFNAKGHLFLNDVLRQLGMRDTPEGAVVGWLQDEDGTKTIEIGPWMNGALNPMEMEGPDGQPVYLLDFNVDGVIWDKI